MIKIAILYKNLYLISTTARTAMILTPAKNLSVASSLSQGDYVKIYFEIFTEQKPFRDLTEEDYRVGKNS